MTTVIFACVQNAGRSQMAAAFFNRLADPARARALSAGTRPASQVHPEVREAMAELGVDLSAAVPQRLTPELAAQAQWLVTLGCGEDCPVVPGVRREDWPLPDPHGLGLDAVRGIRDAVRARVEAFIQEQGWSAQAPS
ncbi:MAG TPA: arsenate reductase ArsC [Holophagaceae bacterium]|nr:arsenate reductase ArsC [Holophagaceae bacterium]